MARTMSDTSRYALAALAQKPRSAYQVYAFIRSRRESQEITTAAVYQMMKALAERGLVDRTAGQLHDNNFNGQIYNITSKGLMLLEQEIGEVQDLLANMIAGLNTSDEARAKSLQEQLPTENATAVADQGYRWNPITNKVVPKAFYDIMVKMGNIKNPSPDHIVDKDGNKIVQESSL